MIIRQRDYLIAIAVLFHVFRADAFYDASMETHNVITNLVTHYGAAGGTNESALLQQAIDDVAAVPGGGDVIIPQGFFNRENTSANLGITYLREWTDDLLNGTWNNMRDSTSNRPADPGYIEAERRVDGSSDEQLFSRLRITQP